MHRFYTRVCNFYYGDRSISLVKKKETLQSYKQKIGFIDKKKLKKKLIWFHGASVGEFQSIVPLLEKFEKSDKVPIYYLN